MKVPFNMTTPRLRLHDGETVLLVQEGLRKKGIFGNRFGELYVTDRRVAFVKAIMKAGLVSGVAHAVGARPIVDLPREGLAAEKVQHKRLLALVLTHGQQSERFVVEPQAVDALLAALQPA